MKLPITYNILHTIFSEYHCWLGADWYIIHWCQVLYYFFVFSGTSSSVFPLFVLSPLYILFACFLYCDVGCIVWFRGFLFYVIRCPAYSYDITNAAVSITCVVNLNQPRLRMACDGDTIVVFNASLMRIRCLVH